jgi:cytoskeletal protein CcmA (bactofilin family)
MAMLGGAKREESVSQTPRINPADAHTIIGRDFRLVGGKITFSGAVRIDGKVEGEIFSDDLLLIGPGAEVKATITIGTIIINGFVEGDLVAKQAVEIKASGRLKGNIVTPSLVIETGAVFDGTCRMSPEEKRPTPPPPPKA